MPVIQKHKDTNSQGETMFIITNPVVAYYQEQNKFWMDEDKDRLKVGQIVRLNNGSKAISVYVFDINEKGIAVRPVQVKEEYSYAWNPQVPNPYFPDHEMEVVMTVSQRIPWQHILVYPIFESSDQLIQEHNEAELKTREYALSKAETQYTRQEANSVRNVRLLIALNEFCK